MAMAVERLRVVPEVGGPSLTKQSMAAEADINQIVARHVAHNVPIFEDARASYGDFTGFADYHSALDAVMAAQDEFMSLPAAVRDHCKNDPGEFLAMVFDEARRPELVELGLVEAAVPVAAVPAEPVVEAPVVPPAP